MNATLQNQDNKESMPDSKLFGLPRPLAGALIGITVYLLLLLLMQVTESILLAAAVLWLGILAGMIDIPSVLVNLYVISSLPLMIIGTLITSKDKATRAIGITMLIIYSAVSILAGMLILFFGNILSS